jgi:hypothetical protein
MLRIKYIDTENGAKKLCYRQGGGNYSMAFGGGVMSAEVKSTLDYGISVFLAEACGSPQQRLLIKHFHYVGVTRLSHPKAFEFSPEKQSTKFYPLRVASY